MVVLRIPFFVLAAIALGSIIGCGTGTHRGAGSGGNSGNISTRLTALHTACVDVGGSFVDTQEARACIQYFRLAAGSGVSAGELSVARELAYDKCHTTYTDASQSPFGGEICEAAGDLLRNRAPSDHRAARVYESACQMGRQSACPSARSLGAHPDMEMATANIAKAAGGRAAARREAQEEAAEERQRQQELNELNRQQAQIIAGGIIGIGNAITRGQQQVAAAKQGVVLPTTSGGMSIGSGAKSTGASEVQLQSCQQDPTYTQMRRACEQPMSQAPCYRAAAILCECMARAGGPEQAEYLQCAQQNRSNANALITR